MKTIGIDAGIHSDSGGYVNTMAGKRIAISGTSGKRAYRVLQPYRALVEGFSK